MYGSTSGVVQLHRNIFQALFPIFASSKLLLSPSPYFVSFGSSICLLAPLEIHLSLASITVSMSKHIWRLKIHFTPCGDAYDYSLTCNSRVRNGHCQPHTSFHQSFGTTRPLCSNCGAAALKKLVQLAWGVRVDGEVDLHLSVPKMLRPNVKLCLFPVKHCVGDKTD